MKRQRGFNFVPYFWSLLAVSAATVVAVKWTALIQVHSLAPFMVSVVLIAWYFGLFPSLATIALSAMSFAYFIAPPAGWAIGNPQDRVRLATFILIGCLFSFLHAARVTAEARARSMLQRLSLALDGTKIGVWDLTLGSGVVWHSSGLEEIYGRDAERFGRSYEVFLGYVHAADRDFVHRTITRSIESGQEYHIQHRIVLPNGEFRWVGTRGRVFTDDKGRAERLVAVTTDLTNQPGVSLPPGAGAEMLNTDSISTVPAPRTVPSTIPAAALPA